MTDARVVAVLLLDGVWHACADFAQDAHDAAFSPANGTLWEGRGASWLEDGIPVRCQISAILAARYGGAVPAQRVLVDPERVRKVHAQVRTVGAQLAATSAQLAQTAEELTRSIDELLVSFREFWLHWPKRKDKKRAETEWLKLKPDQALTDRIIAAVDVQKRQPDWLKDDGQYIPGAAVWLHNQRWEDEIAIGPMLNERTARLAQAGRGFLES